MSFDEKPHPEIVIIRRGGSSDDDGHHGGAWKIAYADFMTAMMALFLVMWLVNATDAKTLAQVATYFNPITLTDRTTTERGVQDQTQGGTGKKIDKQPQKTEVFKEHSDPKNEVGRASNADEGLFSDPYDVLDKLAARAARAAKSPLPTSEEGMRSDASGRMPGGEAFRDPFDPDFRFNSNTEADKSSEIRPRFDPPQDSGGTLDKGQKPQEAKSPGNKIAAMPYGEEANELIDDPADDKEEMAEKAEKTDKKGKPAAKAQSASAGGASDKAVPDAIGKEAAQIETELRKTIKEAGAEKLPDISVEKTPEGVLISMTDQSKFEMFGVSSAEPKPELVVFMEKMAKILSTQPGDVIIRGYTDGRPFRSKTYDNWRLSTSRAHIAQYMLMRGGLDKARFERIEGYADRDLKVPGDPGAAANRRIEILLRPART